MEVALSARHGEAGPILEMMKDLELDTLLPRGRITWENAASQSTFDLMLTSYSLAESHLKCQIHQTEHGSDHRVMETELDIDLTEPAPPVQYLFKNALWNEIKQAVEVDLRHEPIVEGTQNQANQVLRIVLDNVFWLTPIAKPSPYAKRWWTDDLTRLRKVYTRLRNQASTERRAGN